MAKIFLSIVYWCAAYLHSFLYFITGAQGSWLLVVYKKYAISKHFNRKTTLIPLVSKAQE